MRVACFTLFLSLMCPLLNAQSNTTTLAPTTAIGGSFVNQEGAPVKIISLTPSVEDVLDQLTIQNSSSEVVTGVQFAWIFAVPAGCGAGEFPPASGISKIYPAAVTPGHEFTVHSVGVDGRTMWQNANRSKVAYLQYQIGISRVEFANAPTWISPVAVGQLFSPALLKAASKNCSAGKLVLRPKA